MGMFSSDDDAGAAAYRESNRLMKESVAKLEALGVPSVEAQKIALNMPEIAGQLDAEQLDSTALADIIEDPTLRENVMNAIRSESEASETGFSDEDRARMDAMRRSVQGDESARQASIMQSMAERGASGSGSELAARLSSAQGSSDRAAQEAVQLAGQGAAQRRDALGNMANMSSGLRSQDLNKSQNQASAQDAINQFNAMQRAQIQSQNLSERQRIGEQKNALQNQQQVHNKGLLQQDYQNRLQKATGVSGATSNLAQATMQQAQGEAAASQAKAAGGRQLLGTAVQVGATMYGGPAAGGAAKKLTDASQNADGGVKYADGGVNKDEVGKLLEALESMNNPNSIVQNPYTETSQDEAVDQLRRQDVRPFKENTQVPPMVYADGGAGKIDNIGDEDLRLLQERAKATNDPFERRKLEQFIISNIEDGRQTNDSRQYDDGGAPSSYAADGMRIDEKIDNGELGLNEGSQAELMEYLKGNVESDEMTEGRIIEGDSFSGDELPDRINSGEMVTNIGQQDRIKTDLEDKDAELEGFRKLLRLLGKS